VSKSVCMRTDPNMRAGGLAHKYALTQQVGLEKAEKDLAESKKVSAIAGQGRVKCGGER
jgi:hypothetical protein